MPEVSESLLPFSHQSNASRRNLSDSGDVSLRGG
jgi:hypothetical protein